MKACCHSFVISNTSNSDLTEEDLKMAVSKSIEEWKKIPKSHTNTSGPKSSFSFLDQFGIMGAGGGFVMINIQEILEMTSISTRLEMLEKIQYLEDILPDWKDVQTMIGEGLRGGGGGVTPTNSGHLLEHSNNTVAYGYLRLHRKWFHDGRSSPEYIEIQYQLCYNLTICIQEMVTEEQQSTSCWIQNNDDDNKNKKGSNQQQRQQWLFDLLKNWHDMLLDLMQRDHYRPCEELTQIESTLIQILLSASPSPSASEMTDEQVPKKESVLTPFQMLVLIDPQASGISSWIHHLSPHQIVNDFLGRYSLVSILWEHGILVTPPENEEKMMTMLDDDTQPPQQQQPPSSNRRMESAAKWYALSVMTNTLMQLRVSLFPWEWTEKSGDDGKVDPCIDARVRRRQFLDRLLREMNHPLNDDACNSGGSSMDNKSRMEEWQFRLCYAGIETLLSGINHDDEEFHMAKERIKITLGSEGEAIGL